MTGTSTLEVYDADILLILQLSSKGSLIVIILGFCDDYHPDNCRGLHDGYVNFRSV